MKNIGFVLVILFFVIFNVKAQNTEKIERRLERSYQTGNIEKLEKQALKLKLKYPQLEISYYYLSRVEMARYRSINTTPHKKQWNYLRKASGYTKNLSTEYDFWRDSVKLAYLDYIQSWNDDTYKSAHLKKVVQTYSAYTKDTLALYFNYFKQGSTAVVEKFNEIPETDSLRTALIEFASDLVGIPYKYAGETPEVGFDCSGFVKYVYSSIGVNLPHNAHMQSQLNGETITLEEAQPGDLIFFGSKNGKSWRTQHAGIIYEYKEDEPKVIHCVSRGVSIDGNNSSWDSYWKERILFVKRLPELEK